MASVEFWFEFASTYSYPAALRVEALAQARGVAVDWNPFLLGPLFAEQGWRDSPFNIYPVKGRYMWRDMERICAAQGLPLRRPEPFPQNGLLAARVALALDGDLRALFAKAVYVAEFGRGEAIADRAAIARLLSSLGCEADAVIAKAESDDNKSRLRQQGERARALGLPGAPCLVAGDGEVFWGNDRLEQGLDWASGRRGASAQQVG